MRREARDDGLAHRAEVVREGDHLVVGYPGVDEQCAGPAPHDNGVALDEVAPVGQYALRDLSQHEPAPLTWWPGVGRNAVILIPTRSQPPPTILKRDRPPSPARSRPCRKPAVG